MHEWRRDGGEAKAVEKNEALKMSVVYAPTPIVWIVTLDDLLT